LLVVFNAQFNTNKFSKQNDNDKFKAYCLVGICLKNKLKKSEL
jgi:hypothetical protein